MLKSKHAQQRMSQRGITGDMVEMTLMYGEIRQDKYVLHKRGAAQTLEELRDLERLLIQMKRQQKDVGNQSAQP